MMDTQSRKKIPRVGWMDFGFEESVARQRIDTICFPLETSD